MSPELDGGSSDHSGAALLGLALCQRGTARRSRRRRCRAATRARTGGLRRHCRRSSRPGRTFPCAGSDRSMVTPCAARDSAATSAASSCPTAVGWRWSRGQHQGPVRRSSSSTRTADRAFTAHRTTWLATSRAPTVSRQGCPVRRSPAGKVATTTRELTAPTAARTWSTCSANVAGSKEFRSFAPSWRQHSRVLLARWGSWSATTCAVVAPLTACWVRPSPRPQASQPAHGQQDRPFTGKPRPVLRLSPTANTPCGVGGFTACHRCDPERNDRVGATRTCRAACAGYVPERSGVRRRWRSRRYGRHNDRTATVPGRRG